MERMERQWKACAPSKKAPSRLCFCFYKKIQWPFPAKIFKICIFQDSSQERGELEALRHEALSSLVKVTTKNYVLSKQH